MDGLDWLNNGATQMTKPSKSCLNAVDADASILDGLQPHLRDTKSRALVTNHGPTQMTRPSKSCLNAGDADVSILDGRMDSWTDGLDWLNNGARQMTKPSKSCLNAVDDDVSILDGLQ